MRFNLSFTIAILVFITQNLRVTLWLSSARSQEMCAKCNMAFTQDLGKSELDGIANKVHNHLSQSEVS